MIAERASGDRGLTARVHRGVMPWLDDDVLEDFETQLGRDSLGRQIWRLRQRAGWTQRQLQARTGVDQAVISRLENGKQRGISWWRFARLIGTLGGVDPPPDPPKPPWPGPAPHQPDP